jgi:hypothetical protein
MLFTLFSGTDIKRQPASYHLIALDQKKETKTCLVRKKFYLCAREECLNPHPVDVNTRELWITQP